MEIFSGCVPLGTASKANHDHKTVVVPGVTWKVPDNARIGLRVKKVSVHATAGDRTLFVDEMTAKVVAGNNVTLDG